MRDAQGVNLQENSSTDGNTVATLLIPTKVVGNVKGGKEGFQNRTGTSMEFIKNGLETTVKITGTPHSVAEATSAVLKKVQSSNDLLEKVCDSVQPVVSMVKKWTPSDVNDFYIRFGAFVQCSGTTLILRAFYENGLKRAAAHLRSLADEEDGVDLFRAREIYVPDSLVGSIIGKEGIQIIKMRQTTGAKINILEGSDRGGQTKVRIEGSKKEISAAKARIDQLLSWAETRTPRDTLSGNQRLIRIPSSLFGLIVGKGGETIKCMKTHSGAHIMITDDDSETSVIRISGDPANIAEAGRLVYHQLELSKEMKKMSCRSVPAAVLLNWGLAEVVEFFSKTGCLLEVKNNYVKIKGFDKDDMLYAEEQLHELVEDATHNGSPDMAQYRTTHDLGRLHLDEQETSRSSTQAQRKVSKDLKRKAAQSKKAKVKDRLQSN